MSSGCFQTGNTNHSLKNIGKDIGDHTFESLFFLRSYYLGESQLDRALFSLLHFDEVCETVSLPNGYSRLIDVDSIRRRAKGAGGNIKKRLLALEKSDVLTACKPEGYVKFCQENKLSLDNVDNFLPLLFEDYRKVIHCLKLSWAFYLTLKMYKFDDFPFLQRVRKDRGNLWCKTHRSKKGNYLSCIFVHLYSSLSKLGISDEKSIIKCFKNSLCYHVSESLDQDELPEGSRFDLVPYHFRHKIHGLEYEKKIKFFFSLLQSKVLCESVPESFVQETLEKHRNQLSSPHKGISQETLELLRQRGRDFGKLVTKFYKPNKGFNPTNKATFGFPRNKGGVKGDLVFHDVLHNSSKEGVDVMDRIEPLVIGLFGQPGQGKSTALPQIVGILSTLFPGVRREDLVYARTCNTEHWDGYADQPIVVLDDIGQSLKGDDIKEFQTLVSCNPYVLPMADLSEKGKLFSSPIIICTSNLRYGDNLSAIYLDSAGILDDASFWRRFHIPLYCELGEYFQLSFKPDWVREENLLRPGQRLSTFDTTINPRRFSGMDFSKQYYRSKSEFVKVSNSKAMCALWTPISFKELGKRMISNYKSRKSFHDNYRNTWTQQIDSKIDEPLENIGDEFWSSQIEPHLPSSLGFDVSPQGTSNNHSLTFSAFPPEGPLPVRVQPIVEPLKVRTITAGIGDTFCLKPLQRAMWHALGLEPQFCLTHGTNNLEPAIERIHLNGSSTDSWISGDYSAATDSFAISASKALLDGILESIDHQPTKRWAMKEISPHLLVYPKGTGLEPVLQESGQLMGSLLSFPLLCLLNDCTAKFIGLRPDQYLINGDDILMRTHADNYPLWKEKVQEFGLLLSAGKNYIHKDFGTVNSQLIRGGTVLNSGKQRVLDRKSQVLGECLRDLEVLMDAETPDEVHELFKSVNRSKLSRTVRSISVPVSHGGLSFNWGDRVDVSARTKRTEVLVYLNDLFNRITPKKGYLSIPYLSQEKFSNNTLQEMDRCFNEPVLNSEYHEDFLGIPQLENVRRRVSQNHRLRDLFLSQSIVDLPPLNYLHSHQIPFKDVKIRKELQASIDEMFFNKFLDGNETFTYEEFRKDFLDSVKGTKQASSKSVEFLTPIIELDVKPDYLKQVVTGYKAKLFDKNLFSESLSKELKPNRFDLLPIPKFSDYSREIYVEYESSIKDLMTQFDLPPNFSTVLWEEVLQTQSEDECRPRIDYLYKDLLCKNERSFFIDMMYPER